MTVRSTWSTGSSVAVCSSSCTSSAPRTSSRLFRAALLNTLGWTVMNRKKLLLWYNVGFEDGWFKMRCIKLGVPNQDHCWVVVLADVCCCGSWLAWRRTPRSPLPPPSCPSAVSLPELQLRLLSTSPSDHHHLHTTKQNYVHGDKKKTPSAQIVSLVC